MHHDWTLDAPMLRGLETPARARLAGLVPMDVPQGAVLFRPGDSVQAFAIVISGRIEVFLTGPTGREVLLYAVEPGQSCVQTTLGLMGGGHYGAEAIAAGAARLVMVPRAMFLELMDSSAGFRHIVFAAFADRMTGMIQLLERVAFQSVECRLAALLIERAAGTGLAETTHQDLATRIGTAREVVSRRLEALARAGLVRTERGAVHILDRPALERLAASGTPAAVT